MEDEKSEPILQDGVSVANKPVAQSGNPNSTQQVVPGAPPVQPMSKPKKFGKNQIIALGVALILLAGMGFSSWYFYFRDENKASDYIANASSCSKISQLLARNNSNILYETDSLSVSGAITSSAESAQGAGSAKDFSTTNVQVEGVDEADVVKNDGEYIYTITDGNIYIVKAYPAAEAELVSKITLNNDNAEGYSSYGASAIFINGNRLLAVGYKSIAYGDAPLLSQGDGAASSSASSIAPPLDIYPSTVGLTFVKVWDITDKSAPQLVRSVEFEGSYSTARMIGDSVHIVLNGYPRLYNITTDTDGGELIPLYSDVQGDKAADYQPTCSCDQVQYFKNSDVANQYGSNSFTTVLSLPIDNDNQAVNRRTIIGNSETVYASADNLYLASVTYGTDEQNYWTDADTQLHKFKLEGADSKYSASATVVGTVLNQYSMDEYDGNFRIATTKGEITNSEVPSTNHITVLNSNMEQIGSLNDLAPGESIYSARFVGKRAYLVTFKKVDPFYVIDLQDPTKPAVLGYLKIPGYSDYLHPYDENHIIGVGKEAVDASSEETETRDLDFAWYQGMKMAIFDVTDVANPTEMFKVAIGDRGTDSPALTDPKAFLFSQSKNLLALPIDLYELTDEQKASELSANTYGEFAYQGAYVYNVDLTSGFNLRGRITHSTDSQPQEDLYYYGYGNDAVRRILYMGDYLYTISDAKIMINALDDLTLQGEVDLK